MVPYFRYTALTENAPHPGAGLLAANYVGAVVAALRLPGAFRARLMVPAHLLLLAALVAQTARLDRARHSPPAIAAFYRDIWNLFYAGAAPGAWCLITSTCAYAVIACNRCGERRARCRMR